MENNAIIPMNENEKIIDGIRNSDNIMYASFKVETKEDKIKLFNATSGEGERVKDYMNKKILVKDAIVMPVEVENADGSKSVVPRTTLITTDDQYISATSWGVYRALQKILAIFGDLHFDSEPLSLTPVEIRTKKGTTINFKIN